MRLSNLRALTAAQDELRLNRPIEARRILQALLDGRDDLNPVADTSFAVEVEALLRSGLNDEAARRLDLFLNPKFESVGQCRDRYAVAMEPKT